MTPVLVDMNATKAMQVLEGVLKEKERLFAELCADAARQGSAGVIWAKSSLAEEMQALALALDALRGKRVL